MHIFFSVRGNSIHNCLDVYFFDEISAAESGLDNFLFWATLFLFFLSFLFDGVFFHYQWIEIVKTI